MAEITTITSDNFSKYTGLFETLSNLTIVHDIEEEKIKNILDIHKHTGTKLFACVIGDKIVSVTTLLVENKLIRGGGLCGYIEDVSTHKGYEGKGYGTKLIEHALQYARKIGCYKVVLHCKEEIAPFYEKNNLKKRNISMQIRF